MSKRNEESTSRLNKLTVRDSSENSSFLEGVKFNNKDRINLSNTHLSSNIYS